MPILRFRLMDTQTIYPPHDITGWKRMTEFSRAPNNVWKNTDTILFRGRTETGRLVLGVVEGTYLPQNIQQSLNPTCYFEARESFDYGTYPGLEEYGDHRFATPQDRFFAWLYLQLLEENKKGYRSKMIAHDYDEELLENLEEEGDDDFHKLEEEEEPRTKKPPHPDNILGYAIVPPSNPKNPDLPTVKTLYGYVPDEWRTNGIVAVKLRSRKIARQVLDYFESDAYLDEVFRGHCPTIRLYEATTFPLDQQWRLERDLNLGAMIKTNNYYEMTPEEGACYFDVWSVGNDVGNVGKESPKFVRVNYDNLTGDVTTPKDAENPELEPTRLSFDIECESVWDAFLSKPGFPTPRWTPEAYRRKYSKLLDKKTNARIKNAKDVLQARNMLIRELTKVKLAEKDLVEFIKSTELSHPKERIREITGRILNEKEPDTQKNIEITQRLADFVLPSVERRERILAICFILRRNEKAAENMESKLGSFVYTWNPKNGFLKTSEEETRSFAGPFFSQTRYPNTRLEIFDDELSMLIRFMNVLRSSGAEVLQSYNGTGFDLPYVLESLTWYSEYGTPQQKRRLEISNPANIGIIKGFRSRWWVRAFVRGKGMKQKTDVTTSLITSMDLMEVLQNETFGKKMPSYKLDKVVEKELTYPKGSLPMRKLEIRVTKGKEMWMNGGDDLIFFLSYCMVDALLPSLLAEKLAYDTMLFEVANLSGLSTSKVFSTGLSEKVVSLLSKNIHEGGKKFIMPDMGTRELHWPDLWLWNFDPSSKRFSPDGILPRGNWEDVRSLYENVPTLKRKWELSSIRQCKKSRYTPEDVRNCWSMAVRKAKEKVKQIERGKNYVGAHVMQTVRLLLYSLLLTFDFAGMYPSIMMAHHLCYCTMVTNFTKKLFEIAESALFRCVMGPAKYSRCGDEYYSPQDAKKTDSPYNNQVQTWWANPCIVPHAPFPKLLIFLTGMRKAAKANMASWDEKKYQLSVGYYLAKFPRESIKEHAEKEIKNIEQNVVEHQRKFGKKHLIKLQEQLRTLESETNLDDAILEWIKGANLEDTRNVSEIEIELKKATSWVSNYDTKQGALKIFLNGSYGFTGMASGKLSCLSLGGTVTAVGREIIKVCQNVAENTDLIWLIREELKLEEELKKYGVNLDRLGDKNVRAITLGGDTDSIFVYIPRYLVPVSIYSIGQKIGKWIVKRANRYTPRRFAEEVSVRKETETTEEYSLRRLKTPLIPHFMTLENEKTGVANALQQQKNYMQLTPELGFQIKGVASKKGNTLPFWSRIEEHIIKKIILKQLGENEDPQDRISAAVEYLHQELWKPLMGDYDVDEFVLSQNLRKLPDSYGENTRQYRLITRQKDLGKEVTLGDALSWVYTEERADGASWISEEKFSGSEKKGTQQARANKRQKTIEKLSKDCYEEEPEYALSNGLDLDIIYYYKNVVLKKARIIMATLLNDHSLYPLIPYNATAEEEEDITKKREKFVEAQQLMVQDVIFPPEMVKIMKSRTELKYQKNASRMNWNLGARYKGEEWRLAMCVLCNVPFHNGKGGVFSGICDKCKSEKTKKEWIEEIEQHNKVLRDETSKCIEICWNCIKTTTVCLKPSVVAQKDYDPESESSYVVTPEDCTKGHCTIFKKRQKAHNRTIHNKAKLASISGLLDW